MRHRIAAALTRVLRTDQGADVPHFHQGAEGAPAACYDAHCARPRLDVG